MQHLWGHSEVVYEEHGPQGFILVKAHATGRDGQSSTHHHKEHTNVLYVLGGTIILDSTQGQVNEVIKLDRGVFYEIARGIDHRLTFPKPTEFLEWYIPRPGKLATLDDIYRGSPGAKPRAAQPGE